MVAASKAMQLHHPLVQDGDVDALESAHHAAICGIQVRMHLRVGQEAMRLLWKVWQHYTTGLACEKKVNSAQPRRGCQSNLL